MTTRYESLKTKVQQLRDAKISFTSRLDALKKQEDTILQKLKDMGISNLDQAIADAQKQKADLEAKVSRVLAEIQ